MQCTNVQMCILHCNTWQLIYQPGTEALPLEIIVLRQRFLRLNGKVCTLMHSRRAQRKVLLSSRRVIRMQQKYIQKLIDIRGRANISRNIPFNHLFIVLEPFENSAAALKGSWQPSHYSWIGRRQCYLFACRPVSHIHITIGALLCTLYIGLHASCLALPRVCL